MATSGPPAHHVRLVATGRGRVTPARKAPGAIIGAASWLLASWRAPRRRAGRDGTNTDAEWSYDSHARLPVHNRRRPGNEALCAAFDRRPHRAPWTHRTGPRLVKPAKFGREEMIGAVEFEHTIDIADATFGEGVEGRQRRTRALTHASRRSRRNRWMGRRRRRRWRWRRRRR